LRIESAMTRNKQIIRIVSFFNKFSTNIVCNNTAGFSNSLQPYHTLAIE